MTIEPCFQFLLYWPVIVEKSEIRRGKLEASSHVFQGSRPWKWSHLGDWSISVVHLLLNFENKIIRSRTHWNLCFKQEDCSAESFIRILTVLMTIYCFQCKTAKTFIRFCAVYTSKYSRKRCWFFHLNWSTETWTLATKSSSFSHEKIQLKLFSVSMLFLHCVAVLKERCIVAVYCLSVHWFSKRGITNLHFDEGKHL